MRGRSSTVEDPPLLGVNWRLAKALESESRRCDLISSTTSLRKRRSNDIGPYMSSATSSSATPLAKKSK